MYYQRLDVRRAITDFANANGSDSVRECGFYNPQAKSIQRHPNGGGSQTPLYFNTPHEIDRALALGASAFYCSYWRHRQGDLDNPLGRDLVWVIRAEQGGMGFVKEVTAWVIRALEAVGVSEPWVKYSGKLGFDLVIPLETIPCEVWAGSVEDLQGLQGSVTNYIVSYLCERFSEVLVNGVASPVIIKKKKETCLLSELRVKRGLLLAPMSLNPKTGLVSTTLDPKRVEDFSVFDASPEDARGFDWTPPSQVSYELIKYVQPWFQASASERLAAF